MVIMNVPSPTYASLCASGHAALAARAMAALVIALALAPAAHAQSISAVGRGPLPQPIGQRAGDSLDGVGAGDPAEQERQFRALNAERQKSLVSDTNKLLKLANELNAEVSGSNAETLTPAQIRKVGQIEKLARSVKEKMSTSVKGTPAFQQQGIPILR